MSNLKDQLIELLTENARYTNAQLAAIVGAEVKDIENALKELESDGVIVKYAAILNTEAMEKKKVLPLQVHLFNKFHLSTLHN